MLVHHFLICKLPNIPMYACIKSILWSVLEFYPDESWRKAFDVVIIENLLRLLRAELCECESVITLKGVLCVRVSLQL